MIDLGGMLLNADKALFIFLNERLANVVFDWTMPVITNDWFLRVLFVLLIVALLIWGKKQGRITAVVCIATLVATDQVSAHLIKPWVSRVRPCHVIPSVHLLVNCSQGLSFPSSHAANSFGQAIALSLEYRKQSWIFYLFASLVSFSRIAVGVHYPSDVLGGAIIGTLCGLVVVLLERIVNWKIAAPLPISS